MANSLLQLVLEFNHAFIPKGKYRVCSTYFWFSVQEWKELEKKNLLHTYLRNVFYSTAQHRKVSNVPNARDIAFLTLYTRNYKKHPCNFKNLAN